MGMRVKVRFATKVKRDGKFIKKKIWYGGRVTAVSAKRSKIRIKYDDGTSEISKFPDKDVVIDADMNGEHSVPADKFCPPPPSQTPQQRSSSINNEINIEDRTIHGEKQLETIAHYNKRGEEEEGDEQKSLEVSGKCMAMNDIKSQKDFNENCVAQTLQLSLKADSTVQSHLDERKIDVGSTYETSTTLKEDKKLGPSTPPPPSSSDPSPKDGELSPGIIVCKSTEFSEPAPQEAESKQFPSSALSTTINIKKSTELGTMSEKAASINDTGVQHEASRSMKNKSNKHPIVIHSSSTASPKPVKKLSIRIPSNSMASIKGFSPPKSSSKFLSDAEAAKSSPSQAFPNVGNILENTPDQQKRLLNAKTKRKRILDPSTTTSEEVIHPPKRRIKVAIGHAIGNKDDDQEMTTEVKTLEGLERKDSSVMNSYETNIKALSSKLKMLQQGTEERTKEIGSVPVERKKKKKGDHANKSPRSGSKSPIPKRPSSPKSIPGKLDDKIVTDESSPSLTLSKQHQQVVGLKSSDFSTKKSGSKISLQPDTKDSKIVTTTNESAANQASARGFARKAAQDAKEKLTVKEKQKSEKEMNTAPVDSGAKRKKKRHRKDDTESVAVGGSSGHGGEESDDGLVNETEWVQCDSCGKWRVLPDSVKVSSLPNLWYCHMNMYDPKRRACDAPEQTAKQALKDRKRARKRAKRLEQQRIVAESQQQQQQQQEESTSLSSTKKCKKILVAAGSGGHTPSSSPKPQKTTKSIMKSNPKEPKMKESKLKESKPKDNKESTDTKKSDVKKKTTSSSLEEKEKPQYPPDSGSDTQKEGKKKPKKGKNKEISSAENTDGVEVTTTESKKPGRKRGRPARNNNASTESKDDDASKDEDNVEWVQCDKCGKWRKLPPDISADELPDIWDCSMNTWKPASASCNADEDKANAEHHEVGASEWQLRQSHAGKYSYRQMIFGTGARKHNRPMSERTRAAESLFTQPSTDEENPHPTTQYSKSSVFMPRLSNIQKANAMEEKDSTLSIFDVLRHSNLWEDLRNFEQKQNPGRVLSSSSANSGNISGISQKPKTYNSLSNETKHVMQDVVLQILDLRGMTGEEVVRKIQYYPWDVSTMKNISGIQNLCNADIIVNTLLDLVRDGIVEMATLRDDGPMSQWVPKYRKVKTNRAMEAIEAIKASRCMKIAKPWKQKSSSTEWITGQRN